MEPIIRYVRDIDPNGRRVLEQVIGRPLHEDQKVIIQVVTPGSEPGEEAKEEPASQPGKLPEWCNVFAGLSAEQLADVEEVILQRSNLTRPSR